MPGATFAFDASGGLSDVCLDRPNGAVQLTRDRLVGEPSRDQLGNFALATGQHVQPRKLRE